MTERVVIGCMTGTSLDGVDAAAVRVVGEGLGMRVEFMQGVSGGLGAARQPLRQMAVGGMVDVELFLEARHVYAEAVADAVELVARQTSGRPALVALHGQTVFHRAPLSWQVVDPWVVARRLGCPVVSDLRGADLAAGGQGAPITPVPDWILFRADHADRLIVNLGGFCNVTRLPKGCASGEVTGFDVCACNHVLDAAARMGLGEPFDESGEAARRGTPDEAASGELAQLLRDQLGQGRSLGSGDEATELIEHWAGRLSGDNLAATVANGVGRVIGEVVCEAIGADGEVLLAGGGARNAALRDAIARFASAKVRMLDETGVPGTFREAVCMGVLGALASDGVGLTLAGVTGARDPIPLGGSWVNARVNLDG